MTAGVISSVGLHTDAEFKAFTPAEGYNKNVAYKNGECMLAKPKCEAMPCIDRLHTLAAR